MEFGILHHWYRLHVPTTYSKCHNQQLLSPIETCTCPSPPQRRQQTCIKSDWLGKLLVHATPRRSGGPQSKSLARCGIWTGYYLFDPGLSTWRIWYDAERRTPHHINLKVKFWEGVCQWRRVFSVFSPPTYDSLTRMISKSDWSPASESFENVTPANTDTSKLGIKYKNVRYKTESKGGNHRSLMLTQWMRKRKEEERCNETISGELCMVEWRWILMLSVVARARREKIISVDRMDDRAERETKKKHFGERWTRVATKRWTRRFFNSNDLPSRG